tara:strand:+ start:383 stop:544 length:162 start_codon:yes stop_codon:yes gene_type:complete
MNTNIPIIKLDLSNGKCIDFRILLFELPRLDATLSKFIDIFLKPELIDEFVTA